jgi:hypothetical protein
MDTSTLVQKLWTYCKVLRDDGMCYSDEPRLHEDGLEQLAYQSELPLKRVWMRVRDEPGVD